MGVQLDEGSDGEADYVRLLTEDFRFQFTLTQTISLQEFVFSLDFACRRRQFWRQFRRLRHPFTRRLLEWAWPPAAALHRWRPSRPKVRARRGSNTRTPGNRSMKVPVTILIDGSSLFREMEGSGE